MTKTRNRPEESGLPLIASVAPEPGVSEDCRWELSGMASTQVTIVPRHDFSADEIDQIEDWLYEYNRGMVGQHNGRKLGFAAVDRHGAQVGAIAGYSWARMAEIKQLWVAETHRGKGLGRSLLQTAVVEASARDCRLVWVMTYDFQAPGLYERCGFRARGRTSRLATRAHAHHSASSPRCAVTCFPLRPSA